MSKEIINSNRAPAPIGPYNQAIKTGNLLFISGQIALKPGSNELIQDSIAAETRQVMQNLQSILAESGMNFSHVIKTTIFLIDMGLFNDVNEVYGSYFKTGFPARETVAVRGLPKGASVEISMIAAQ